MKNMFLKKINNDSVGKINMPMNIDGIFCNIEVYNMMTA